jgi:hypothetical protein
VLKRLRLPYRASAHPALATILPSSASAYALAALPFGHPSLGVHDEDLLTVTIID